MSDASPPWRAVAGGLEIHIRLTPRGGRDALERVAVQADGKTILKARVSAPPDDGGANDALIRLIAKSLRRPASSVTLASGHTARVKTLVVAGDAERLAADLQALVDAPF